jgi:hypothetical protein
MSFQLKIFNWFFSFLLLISSSVLAQQTEVETNEDRLKKSEEPIQEGKPKKQKTFFERDLKFGWDVSNLLVGALNSSRTGIDFSVDYTIKKNLFGIGELGQNNYQEASEAMDYYSDGTYFRLGFDSKMNDNESNTSRDIFYLGARYAFATFEQRLENYQINSSYWPSATGNNISYSNQAHWAEAIAGFKVEVLKNMYLGLGLRFKFILFQTGDKTVLPAPYIPGFGKTSGPIVVGFNYNVYYNLPLNYSKKLPKREH